MTAEVLARDGAHLLGLDVTALGDDLRDAMEELGGSGAALELRAHATQPEPHASGQTFALVTEARVDGELVWSERSTMLRRKHRSSGRSTAPRSEASRMRGLPLALILASGLWLAAAAAVAKAAGSPQVAALQVALRATGTYSGSVDGLAGPGTRAGTASVQRRRGLVVDGIAGPATRRALGRAGRGSGRVLQVGESGWDIAALQFSLGRHGFPSGPVDGGFGERTAGAVRRFQSYAGLGSDGVAGPATRRALRGPPPRSVLRFAPPAAGLISDGFGPRGTSLHPGVDYPLPFGASVRAAGRGCVVWAGFQAGGYGNLVVIKHRAGMTTLYAHLQRVDVGVGRCLVAGVQIGTVGSSGFSTGPHLHFEMRLRGAAVDPRSGL